MKVFKITAKNIRLLLRSKTSMFVILFGPLIIMLLVGFAFNNPSTSKLNIGYYAPEKSDLTRSFVDALTTNPTFSLIEFPSTDNCKDNIEQGKLHMCIVFPANFIVKSNDTNEIIFYVDQSRANFVYSVIDTVASKVDITSNKLSTSLTNDLLNAIISSQKTNADNIAKIIALKNSVSSINTKLAEMQTKLNTLDLSGGQVDSGDTTTAVNALNTAIDELKLKADDAVDSGEQLIIELDACSGCVSGNGTNILNNFDTETEKNFKAINVSFNKTINNVNSLRTTLALMTSSVDKLNAKLSTAKTTTTDSTTKIAEIQTSLSAVKADLDTIKASIEKVDSQINALKVTSAESIVNPIQTTITPITSKANNLNFVFPYLIILIIAFISIMLSSTIIIMEKTSKAYFRNFTTPTKDITFIISVFLTSFFVVIIQLVFILLCAYYFLNTTLVTNVSVTLLVIFCAITLFTFIGMIIGYLFNSQEAVTMASISVGSIFLFLSNLILPLETMSAYIQEVARYNPYVIASELLKKTTLFETLFKDVLNDLLLMGLYIAVTLILTVVIQKTTKIHYISKKSMTKPLLKKDDDIIDKYLKLKNGALIRNEKELLKELKEMSDTTFKEYVDDKKNDFESWLIINKKHELAKKIGPGRNRKEMVSIIEKFLKE